MAAQPRVNARRKNQAAKSAWDGEAVMDEMRLFMVAAFR